jgi:hypothetical protein
VTVSWFEPQNQVGFSLSVASQNRQREDGVGHALRSSDLFYMEASRFRVFQSGLKTSMGVTVGDARGIIAEVVWSSSRRRMGRRDRLRRTLLPVLCHFLCIMP